MITKIQKLNSQCCLLRGRSGSRMGCSGKRVGGGGGGKYFGSKDSNNNVGAWHSWCWCNCWTILLQTERVTRNKKASLMGRRQRFKALEFQWGSRFIPKARVKRCGSNEDALSIFKSLATFPLLQNETLCSSDTELSACTAPPLQHHCCWEQQDKRFAAENDHSPPDDFCLANESFSECSLVLEIQVLQWGGPVGIPG